MDEEILNEKYKFVYDPEKKFWLIHINGIPSPLKPDKMFKFYAANLNNIASLHEGYFWLSNPREFNDPFDCNINLIDCEYYKTGEPKLNNLINIGLTCFTEVLNEPLLWAHYAQDYNGYAIEFDTDVMGIVEENNEKKFELLPVMYFDDFIRVKDTDNYALTYLLSAKSARWEYEKEWRLVASLDEAHPYKRIRFYYPQSIKALYLGYKLLAKQESVFNLIQSIFMTKYPDKPIYLVRPDPYKIELNIIKLD
jgi:hypothetical protein